MEKEQAIPSGLLSVLGDYRESGPLSCHNRLEVLDMVSIALQCPPIIDAWIRCGAIELYQGFFIGPKRQLIDNLNVDIQAVLQIYNLIYRNREQMINVLRCEARMSESSEVSIEAIVFWDAVRVRLYEHYVNASINILKTGNGVLAVSLNNGDHMEGLLISIDELEGIIFHKVRLPFNLSLPRVLRVKQVSISDGSGIVYGDRAEEHFCLKVTFSNKGTSSRSGVSYSDIEAVLREKLEEIFELN